MKQVKIALLALLVFVGFNGFAQDQNNPWAINIGVNAVDYFPTNADRFPGAHYDQGENWFDEYFNAEDHYNVIPTISSLSVGRYLNDGFSLELGASLNKITKMGNDPEYNPGNLALLAVDADVKYALQNIFGKKGWFDPYLMLGGGYTWLDWEGTGTLNGGLGLNLWASEHIGFNVQTQYKHSFDNLYAPYFQHNAGFVVKFGGTDTDKDGIYDKDDACPEVFGLVAFQGCPDTDGDGIKDGDDRCPEVAGPAEFKGCPDTDGDGIVDVDDDCPTVKGLAAFKGCPDTDADGLADKNDDCPTVAGPKENKGCPWPDTDGDGILDKDDACPKVAGVKEEKGCPAKPKVIITEEAKAQLDSFAKAIYFNSGKDTFKPGTTENLDKIAAIMTQYPEAKFSVDGHTDSDGDAKMNLNLSERRAGAVKKYLESKGVTAGRLTAAGFGEDKPVASNKTTAGKAENRRVEINLVK